MIAQLAKGVTAFFLLTVPLYAQNTPVPEGYENFEAYELAMYQRIGELANQGGLDITGLLARRDELRAEYTAAEQSNDSVGMRRAEALRATLIRAALEEINRRTGD